MSSFFCCILAENQIWLIYIWELPHSWILAEDLGFSLEKKKLMQCKVPVGLWAAPQGDPTLLLCPFSVTTSRQDESRGWSRSLSEMKKFNGNPLQYSCLENPMDGGAWSATVHGVAKSQTRLSDFTFYFHALENAWNGNPLQCSCLGNPRDGGAWWAAVYGAQSWTRRKWLSSSSSTPVFLPGEFHGQKSLASYSPWGHREPDITEWLTLSLLKTSHSPVIVCSHPPLPWTSFKVTKAQSWEVQVSLKWGSGDRTIDIIWGRVKSRNVVFHVEHGKEFWEHDTKCGPC